MPELAAVYALGVLVSLSLAAFMLWSLRRRRQMTELKTLNANLAKVALFWSDHKDSLLQLNERSEESELQALTRSLLVTSLIFSAMSWLGLGFLLVLFASIRFLARSRLERRLLASPLAQDPNLSSDDVRRLIDEARSL